MLSDSAQGPFASSQFTRVGLENIVFSGLQPVTLAIRTISGNGEVSIIFRVREDW